MLCFSSCWNNSRHPDGAPMIQEIVDLGFQNIELSHGMTIAKLPGIQDQFKQNNFKCCGVHNFFPSPVEVMIDAPDAYEFTSHRPNERQRAIDLTKRTIELGAKFGASYIVLHMGSVPLNPKKFTKNLTALTKQHLQTTPKFTKAKIKFVKKREKLSPLYYQRAIDAIDQILPTAKEHNITLAIESRSRFEDVPTEDEMLQLQQHFAQEPLVGYWHDFGHVQLKHNIGILDHHQWLTKMLPYLVGCHVHDVYWPDRDHRVPLTGEINYQKIIPMLDPFLPLVWELSPTRKASEISSSLEQWHDLFPETI